MLIVIDTQNDKELDVQNVYIVSYLELDDGGVKPQIFLDKDEALEFIETCEGSCVLTSIEIDDNADTVVETERY